MADKACHALGSTARLGLVQALGRMKQNRSLLFFGAILVIVGVSSTWSLVSTFFASGDCVSSGGSYNYSLGVCDYTEIHIFLPFYRDWSFWMALAGIIGGGLAFERGAGDNAA